MVRSSIILPRIEDMFILCVFVSFETFFYIHCIVISYGPFLPENVFLLLTGRFTCIITAFFYFNEASEDSVQTLSSINATSSKKERLYVLVEMCVPLLIIARVENLSLN